MKAVLRVWWTLFTAYPVQRVLAYIGMVLFVLGAGLGLLFKPPDRSAAELMGVVGLVTLWIFILFPAAFLAGVLFRQLSSPRPHRLLPHFRVKMLAALLLLVGCAALPWYVTVELTEPARETSGQIDASLVFPTILVSVLVLGLFLVSGSVLWATTILLSLGAFLIWASTGGATALAASGTDVPLWSAIATALVWLVFGIWYLRARSIRSLDMNVFSLSATIDSSPQGPARSAPASLRTDFTPAEALSIWFWGSVQKPLLRQVAGLLTVTAILLLIVFYVLAPSNSGPSSRLFGAVIVAVVSPMLFLLVNRLARQSRHLWLRIPGSRSAVFHVTERLAARQCLLPALPALSLAIGIPFVVPDLSFAQSFAVLGIAISGGAYAFYAGLAAVRGSYAVWSVAMIVLLASQGVAIWAILAEPFRAGWFAGVVGFHLLMAAWLRPLAARHWRQIDWLRIKPSRIASQSLRQA